MLSWLPSAALYWQLAVVGLVLLPHLIRLPLWLSALLLATSLARIQMHRGVWAFPRWPIKSALLLLLLVGLLLSFNQSTLMSGTLSLLLGGMALKMLEVHTRRDALVLVYLCYLMIATHFLYETGILHALYALLCVWLVLSSQITLFDPHAKQPITQPLRSAGRLLLPALPLMALLFVLIPRIGPLWSIPQDTGQRQTGLGEQISPGDVSRLTRSDALAFRARFEGAPPAPAQRYWRSLIYSQFDGRQWSIDTQAGPSEPLEPLDVRSDAAASLRYEITMEPSYRPWLVALDQPQQVQGANLGAQRLIAVAEPVQRRMRYQVESATAYRLGDSLSAAQHARYTALPAASNPQSQQLAQQLWRAAGADVDRFVAQMLGRFAADFHYTLQPPVLAGAHSVDQFLFDTQRGFCAHYASASALMLRSVGVPARLVGGYQGGEWNREGYLSVRQYDAHAWVEYFVPQRGWVRLDPTAAVAPERIEQSAQSVFVDRPGFLADRPLSALRLNASSALFQLRQQIDALNFAWQRWVLNYHDQQASVLDELLGGMTPIKLALALLLPSGLVLTWVAWQLRPKRQRLTPLQRAQRRFDRALQRLGEARPARQPIYALAKRWQQRLPKQAAVFAKLAEADERRRYAPETYDEHLLSLALIAAAKVLERLPSSTRAN